MKIFKWVSDNVLFVIVLFLLAFIPLYPKKPILDVVNTWVYIRAEDFVVLFALLVWGIFLIRKKVTLKTPLTLPILAFWITGAVATIHGVLIIFPTLANVFPNVALLSFLRRIEYISLFFIAFSSVKDKRFINLIVVVLVTTLLLVVAYGMGQKYYGFPAYLTMNEEFAKGIPIQLSSLSRVPSTFAGHYDLAAYLVLIIPILASLIFGFRNWIIKMILAGSAALGVVLLFMTVSRVSFFVLFISLALLLFFQKKKFVLLAIPIVFILSLALLSFAPSLVDRFGSTVKEIDVLVDAKTGEPIGHIKEVSSSEFQDNIIVRKVFRGTDESTLANADAEDLLFASPSAYIPAYSLPPTVIKVSPPNAPTGENLPQGTGYINLSLSPVTKKIGNFFYDTPSESKNESTTSAFVSMYVGNFLVKKASAYDLSFTTRYQGEWPNAIEAFKRSILFGSGYASISLAIDNNYLRILGEIGLLGFASFIAIFVVAGLYIKRVLPEVDSPVVKSFVIGVVAGVFGLGLNAILIDVFEASKVAFVLWMLMGLTLGLLHLYKTRDVNIYQELKKVLSSTPAIASYITITAITLFSPMVSNYFTGDDFTWLRWASDCSTNCSSFTSQITSYFTQADGFFYRPGTKVYFLSMYSMFWLNQTVYHVVSVLLHLIVALLVFLLAKKILNNTKLSALATFLFLILSGYLESIFWIAATGHLFNALFILLSLLTFIAWDERKNRVYLVISFLSFGLSMLFHELGVVVPVLILLYLFTKRMEWPSLRLLKQAPYSLLPIPIILYLVARYAAQSHWFSGDYNYNLLKLPFNAVGNVLGYAMLSILGPISLPIYQMLRNVSKGNIIVSLIVLLVLAAALVFLYKLAIKRLSKDDKRVLLFGFGFFIISLLPFLGLGNMSPRYSYLASAGMVIILAFLIQRVYWYLLSSGKDIAMASVATLLSVFFLFHIIQAQQIHSDWYEAGEKSKRFFVSIDELYADYWSKEPMEFHFVNVPIRVGEAWVFPVGIKDALFLIFRNPNIQVYQWQTVDEALNAVDGTRTQKVLLFDESGKVTEKKKILGLQ